MDAICTAIDCTRKCYAKGYCAAHYKRMTSGRPINGKPLQEKRKHLECMAANCHAKHYAKGLCESHYQSDYHALNFDHVRAQRIEKQYGLTPERYLEILLRQDNKCAICRVKPGVFHIDHDHACCSGRNTCGNCVRGLLCGTCNQKLAVLEDSTYVASARKYLREYEG